MPGDRFEIEADRTADRVVNDQTAGQLAGGVSRIVQRAPTDKKLELQTKGSSENEKLQPKPTDKEDLAQARLGHEELRAKPLQEEQESLVQRAAAEAQSSDELQRSPADDEQVQSKTLELDQNVQAKAPDDDLQSKAVPEEQLAQAKNAPKGELEDVQGRASGRSTNPVTDDVARQIRASRGLGNLLPGDMRAKMSAAFGADVSGVRIHTDAPAALLSRSLGAQAFAVGSDIFFAEGKFSPGSRDGQHLLAHELTHTIQQGAVESDPEPASTIRLSPEQAADETYSVRPEIVEAIRLARGEIGKVNAKKAGADGKRVGWERLREYFSVAFGSPVISEAVIDKIVMIEKRAPDGTTVRLDALPSWCGIFTWWALKKAGIPIPDWKLGAPALDIMQERPAGSLPRKGDLALHVLPNNHFAIVTGIESAKDAEGKPAKMVRIATVNGNTAGEDNLGGQIQERWDTLSRWDHFLDPVGKLNLPDLPLVTVGRAPSEAEGPAETAQSMEEGPEEDRGGALEAAGAVDEAVKGLDHDVPPPSGDMFGEAPPEPDMTLPPPVDAGPAEEVAVVAKVDLSGSSDQATTAFIDASPSAMAMAQPDFGATIDAKMKGEQQEIVDNPPQLAAKTSGSVDVPAKSASEIPVPSDTSLQAAASPMGQGDLDKVSLADPSQYRGNADREKDLDQEESGSFWDAFMNFVRRFIDGIKTTDGSVDTSAGKRPSVDLSDDASPKNMTADQKGRTEELRAARDEQVTSFKNNPGQSRIQPKKVDETFAAPVSEKPAATIQSGDDEAVRDFAEAPLPADVRDKADQKIAQQMAPDLADARAQTADAATTRDTDKKTEIDKAQTDAAKINTDADADQRKIVVDNRTKIAALQGEGIGEAYGAVNGFSEEASKRQGDDRKEIDEHVKTEQGAANAKIDQGEKEAREAKEKTEKEAAEKKKKVDEERKKQSWWQRAKNAIKSAVKAVTKWIDDKFNALRKWVKDKIEEVKNFAINIINKARNWVVDKINRFRTWAHEQVDKYLKDTFPGLAKRINEGIDAVADTAIEGVNKAADWAIEQVNKLAKALAAALDKILSTFQVALKTAVRVVGAVMQGDFLEALRAAIEGACEIAGIDPKPVFDFLDRAGKAIRSILKDPVGFIKKLFGAVGDGIRNFFINIKKHLIDGVIGWLTGALAEVNLTGPFEFTPKGILKIVLEILGLTYANIKARVIAKVPAAERVFDLVEQGFGFLKRLVTEGPGALWEEIKERVSSIKETVLGAIRSWLITTVLKEGIKTLLMMTNPAGAIVKAVELLYNLVMFLIERYEQIKDFILSVYEAVSELAAGNFTKVVKAVEDALARVVPVLISLLASLIGLGGIAKQVQKVIEAITKPINRAIDWVVDKVIAFAQKVVAKVAAGAKKVKEKAAAGVEKVKEFLWPKKKFTADGENHTVYFEIRGDEGVPYIRSTPTALESFVDDWEASTGSISSTKRGHLVKARTTIGEIKKLTKAINALKKEKKTVPAAKQQQMLALETELCVSLSGLLGTSDDIAKAVERYKLEGLTGTYSTVPKPSGDYLTGDHQPQAAAIIFLSDRSYFKGPEGQKMRNRAAGSHADNAYIVNLQGKRHQEGRTYGGKGSATKNAFETEVKAMEKTKSDPVERRKEAVKLLKAELREDVAAMRSVYKRPANDSVWADLDPFFGTKPAQEKAKDKLVKQIRAQVMAGENTISAQPMTELCG